VRFFTYVYHFPHARSPFVAVRVGAPGRGSQIPTRTRSRLGGGGGAAVLRADSFIYISAQYVVPEHTPKGPCMLYISN
jgi:hypothetical protein